MLDKYELHRGDCLELMKTIPNASVDLILCDLPYGTTACAWDSVIPFDPLWEQYRRIAKKNAAIVLTASQPFTTALIWSNMKMFKYCWVWEKGRASGFVHAKNKPMKAHEDIAVFSRGVTVHASQSTNRMTYNPIMEEGTPYKRINSKDKFNWGGQSRPSQVDGYETTNDGKRFPRSVIKFSGHNGGSVHPTQKPVDLMEYLIKTYTNEGDVVMDNCMGSGTTGVASANTGRKFIGIELDSSYFEIASKRIEDAYASAESGPYRADSQPGVFDAAYE